MAEKEEIPRVILASTSRHRRALMDMLGIGYEAVSPGCGEDLPPGTPPSEGTAMLARRKAESVAGGRPGSIVIGADQMAVLDGAVLGKPGTAERAVDQLLALAGRVHELWTSLFVTGPDAGDPGSSHTEVWRMRLRKLTAPEAEEYVRRDAPLDCAGSYRFESAGASLFDSAEGNDPTAITGLPLAALALFLRRRGINIPL